MKVAIIGVGHVSSTLAYALVLKHFCDHLVISSRSYEKALGDVLDLQHTLAFCEHQMTIEAAVHGEVINADIIVIAASVTINPNGFSSRLQLASNNIPMFRELIPPLAANNPKAVLIVVTNPVDIMTFAAYKLSGFPAHRVMGVGTLVDSARFRSMLSQQEKIHPDDLRTYILGEHGPNQFPLLSNAQTGGELIGDTESHRKIFSEVVQAGFDVFRLKGYTNYAVATAASVLIQSIVFDEHRTLPVITPFEQWSGVEKSCFSIPVVVGRIGIIRHLHPVLSTSEHETLQTIAATVTDSIATLVPDLWGA